MPLPIGFFMPLPLPIMIPFMMWQSAAIAVGFGTMFQYSKRKISAMSNEEFNELDPIKMINLDLDNIINEMPSSFKKISSVNIMILDAMNQMLDDAIRWFGSKVPGIGPSGTDFEGPGLPVNPPPSYNFPNLLPPAFGDPGTQPPTKIPGTDVLTYSTTQLKNMDDREFLGVYNLWQSRPTAFERNTRVWIQQEFKFRNPTVIAPINTHQPPVPTKLKHDIGWASINGNGRVYMSITGKNPQWDLHTKTVDEVNWVFKSRGTLNHMTRIAVGLFKSDRFDTYLFRPNNPQGPVTHMYWVLKSKHH